MGTQRSSPTSNFNASGQTMAMPIQFTPADSGTRKVIDGESQRRYVAFDYVLAEIKEEGVCRSVTMDLDGVKIRIGHKSGERKFVVGFRDK